MPFINIFDEVVKQSNEIKIVGKKNKARILFSTLDGKNAAATLEVCSRSKLFRKDIYKKSVEEKSETLIHEWKNFRHHHAIIKYAGEGQQAFVFEMEDKLSDHVVQQFEKLAASRMLPTLEYFREENFCQLLDLHFNHTSVNDLRKLPGMDDARISLLSQHCDAVASLAGLDISFGAMANLRQDIFEFLGSEPDKVVNLHKRGLTLSLLNNLDAKTLQWIKANSDAILFLLDNDIKPEKILTLNKEIYSNFFKNYTCDTQAFKFITVNQALGIDHAVKPLNQLPPAVDESKIVPTAGIDGKFSYSRNGNQVIIKHDPDDSVLKIQFESVKSKEKNNLKKYSENYKQIDLVYHWYLSVDNAAYYCPDLKVIMVLSVGEKFPFELFRSGACRKITQSLPFFNEYDFISSLEKSGCPVVTLRMQHGMTQKKLEWIFQYSDALYSLLDHGLILPDIAQVESQRLCLVLKHYESAKSALHFVSPNELLGLNDSRKMVDEYKDDRIAYFPRLAMFPMPPRQGASPAENTIIDIEQKMPDSKSDDVNVQMSEETTPEATERDPRRCLVM